MNADRTFFIGWSAEAAGTGRRQLLGTGLALAAGASGGLIAALASGHEDVGGGVWDDGEVRTLRGVLSGRPYPLLRTADFGDGTRTVFLATDGKAAARLPAPLLDRGARVSGTLIHRGRHAMLAVESIAAEPGADPAGQRELPAEDLGEVVLAGEILDAKCWFGAMRPGYGKTHKSCASLCARGGLPLAFCRSGDCGSGLEAPLFLDARGSPHGNAVLPFVGDPLLVRGRLVRVGDVVQLRAELAALRRA